MEDARSKDKPSLADQLFGVVFFLVGLYLIYYLLTGSSPQDATHLAIWVVLIGLCFALAVAVYSGKGLQNITLVKIGS